MGNWKELGVVPDSDEEDFDSDDSSQLSSPLSPPPSDIWEFPGSSEPTANVAITFCEAPETTHRIQNIHATSSRPTQSQSLGEQPTSPLHPDAQDNGTPGQRISESPDPLGDTPTKLRPTTANSSSKHTTTPSFVRTKARPSLLTGSSLRHDEGNGATPHEIGGESSAQTPANSKLPGLHPTVPASESPEPGRRSLRPRKPIQEHPYLLENEKYSRFMKTHGVKPVRVTVPQETAVVQGPEEDSQDRDYTGDDSQPTSGLPDEDTQMQQSKTSNSVQEDDLDELALSPSLKTSSPQHHLRASSEQSPAQHTDITSLSDDEEFPDIRDLGLKGPVSLKSSKRKLPAQFSTSKKRLRTNRLSLQDSPSRVPADTGNFLLSPDRPPSRKFERSPILQSISARPVVPNPATSRTPSPHPEILSRRSRTPDAPLILISSGESNSDNERGPQPDDPASESDSDMLRRTGKRIKGVLPASWLRLDQQTRIVKSRKIAARTSPPRDLEQPRPGLATRKFGPSKSTVSTRTFLDELNDDSDDNDANARKPDNEISHRNRAASRGDNDMPEFDNGASVVEEDFVDIMMPSRKRRSVIASGRLRKRQKTAQKVFKEPAHKRYQQPEIFQSFHHSEGPSSGATKTRRPGTGKHAVRQLERLMSPPALGIVDFMQPNAPSFVKIAARAASRRDDMGRSKPSYKSIDLGNRTDNVDALSVLRDWRSGKLKPSQNKPCPPNYTTLRAEFQTKRHPLGSLSTNTQRKSHIPGRLSFTQPQKLTRQMNIDDFSTRGGPTLQSPRQLSKATKIRRSTSLSSNHALNYRPAQLEDEMLQDTRFAFTARKKMLDLVFSKNSREMIAPTFKLQQPAIVPKPMPSAQSESLLSAVHDQQHDKTEQQRHLQDPQTTGRRPRKAAAPRRLDLEAPQFRHANDPLPLFNEPCNDEVQTHLQTPDQSKISGLGPFGTHYTHHFEVFPLHKDTYFHHSTLIGDGTLKKVLETQSTDLLNQARPATSFDLLDLHIQWGTWTDTTSSELGLLFDLMTDQLERGKVFGDPAIRQPPISCANHVLEYILQSAKLDQKDSFSAFSQRLSNLLLAFLESTKSTRIARDHDRTLLEINVRLLMCASVVLRFCQGAGELSSECLQAENVVQQYAKVVIQQLLESGLLPIRSLYDDLQRLSTRERGIRNNAFLMVSWVIVIKVLGSALIPRAGFWDLTSSAMATVASMEGNDARDFEGLWENLFTLLPLGEFDDMGVLSKGMRYIFPLQGWILPQKLLKHVFDSYQRGQKQSPNFNEYCRALLARCHHLIEQWGWYKCVGVVGTIFDFFGSRYLSHLRNEEVYKSPDFLEELSGSPSLSIQPGDRCFHIFLKLLALAIQQLKRQGLSSDIRNLVARCLPNHDRQYSKEQTVHFDDLASLRNHHDLLCTLFWSAPREDRRPIELIEKLVSPANSHKEACLINLRAWSQLARFVVSSGGLMEDFRPFMVWQNNMFQQILTQYLTATTDVQQQFMSLAKEKRKDIQQHMLDAVVRANQDAAKDILYASVQASLEVMKHCPSLASATFSFNVTQMNKVFDKLVNINLKLDWGVLRACFDTIDSFVTRLENLWFQLKQASGDSISSLENHCFEDAVEFLDDKVVRGFFVAVRRAMGSIPPGEASGAASPAVVVEKAIILSGRIASLFIDGGKRQLKHFFSPGNSDLFGGLPHELGLVERKYVPLFVATLLKNHIFNFSSIGCSHFDIWIQSLVKPFLALRYENYLAETLKALDIGYMKGATVINGAAPRYDTNRDFFACGITHMRKELRQADVAQRKSLRTKYENLLKIVMQQIRAGLKSLELNSVAHRDYIRFVHEVVGLIKSRGGDICTVDGYFYQVSAEYSPAKEDPQLHTAGILAYGLRLEEGDTTAIPQLFYYLYNHFKTSLANGQIEAEVKVVQNGMKDDKILTFVIGRMLPAIIQTSSHAPHVWPLLGVYSTALQGVLDRSSLPREIPQSQIDDVVMLLETIIDWLRRKSHINDTHASTLTATDTHIFTELVKICNSIRPSLASWLFLPACDRDCRVEDCLDTVTALARSASTYFDNLRVFPQPQSGVTEVIHPRDVVVRDLFAGWKETINSRFLLQMNSYVASFAQNLECELRTNWVVTQDIITVKAAVAASAQPSGGQQSARGVKNDLDGKAWLVSDLLAGLKIWVNEMGQCDKNGNSSRKKRRRPRRLLDDSTTIDCLLYGA